MRLGGICNSSPPRPANATVLGRTPACGCDVTHAVASLRRHLAQSARGTYTLSEASRSEAPRGPGFRQRFARLGGSGARSSEGLGRDARRGSQGLDRAHQSAHPRPRATPRTALRRCAPGPTRQRQAGARGLPLLWPELHPRGTRSSWPPWLGPWGEMLRGLPTKAAGVSAAAKRWWTLTQSASTPQAQAQRSRRAQQRITSLTLAGGRA